MLITAADCRLFSALKVSDVANIKGFLCSSELGLRCWWYACKLSILVPLAGGLPVHCLPTALPSPTHILRVTWSKV